MYSLFYTSDFKCYEGERSVAVFVGVIVGEFIGARQGLGYLIIYGSQTFKLNWMLYPSIFILCVIAMTLYGILGFAEKRYRKHF